MNDMNEIEDFMTDLDYLSEPSTSLSISNDVLDHLMPSAIVPSLDMRHLRLQSRAKILSNDPNPWTHKSTRPPPQPHNHGIHQDEVFLPANRPENFLHPNHIFNQPHRPSSYSLASNVSNNTSNDNDNTTTTSGRHTHRHIRPSTTDPGTLTARYTKPDTTQRRVSSANPTSRKRGKNNTSIVTNVPTYHMLDGHMTLVTIPSRPSTTKSNNSNTSNTTNPHFRPSSSGTTLTTAATTATTNQYNISPRLEEISRSPEYRRKKKVFGPEHRIIHNGLPPRLAYYVQNHSNTPHPSLTQKLPDRKDHPELPTNTPTIAMHRPQALKILRSQKQMKLLKAAKLGEPHAILQLEKQKLDRKVQIRKNKVKRALKRSILMATLDRFSKGGGAAVIRNRAKDGTGGKRLSSKELENQQKNRLKTRSFVYQEWDEYRDHTELTNTDTVHGKHTKVLRKEMDHHDTYVKEHAVLWKPRTAKGVLAEERLVKELLKSADLKTQNRFKNYKPAVSHGNTRKIIGIKRAGDRYLEGLIMLRETSQEDEVFEDVNAVDFNDPDPYLMERLCKGIKI